MTKTSLPINVKEIERRYEAVFLGDFPTKSERGWGPAGAVFYQANPDISKGHKHLFGISYDYNYDVRYIYDASYLEGRIFTGAVCHDGSYVWSTHVHDYRQVPGGALDGGFDYLRIIGEPKLVSLQIKEGKVVVVND